METDPTEWTESRLALAIERIAAELEDAAAKVRSTKNFTDRVSRPYLYAASETARFVRSTHAQIDFGSLFQAAFDAETITAESLEREAEEARKAEAAKTEQWFDGEAWYPVTRKNTAGSSRSHYFVNGAGQGDGSICAKVIYDPASYSGSTAKPLCKTCDARATRR